MKTYLFLLALFSISFSSLLWQTSTDGEISTKPLAYDNKIIIGSSDGYIYALQPSSGSISWKANVGGEFTDVIESSGSILAATTDCKIIKLNRKGEKIWDVDLKEQNATHLFGASYKNNLIYAATNNGLYSINKEGTEVEKIYSSQGVITPPAIGDGFIVFASKNKLIKLRDSGTTEWKKTLSGGTYWISRPVISGNSVFIGALDNKMHGYQLQGGYNKWSVLTKNWVLNTPHVQNGMVYFGSNDGYVYAVSEISGEIFWKSKTQLAVQSEIESGFMGGHEVVFVGSTDKNIYAMKKDNGEIVWKGSATDWVSGPLFYQNMIIFGSHDGEVYAFSTERACSITDPGEGTIIGGKELVVKGKSVSESGAAKVFVSINNAIWEEASLDEEGSWAYRINPSKKLNKGLNTISCKVVDAAGEETGSKLTTVGIVFDDSIEPSELVVTVSPVIVENEPFTVYVNDGDDGSPVEMFELTVGEKNYSGNESINLTLSAGSYPIMVQKIGFEDYKSTIEVHSTGIDPIFIGVVLVIILVIIWLVWSKLIAPRFKK